MSKKKGKGAMPWAGVKALVEAGARLAPMDSKLRTYKIFENDEGVKVPQASDDPGIVEGFYHQYPHMGVDLAPSDMSALLVFAAKLPASKSEKAEAEALIAEIKQYAGKHAVAEHGNTTYIFFKGAAGLGNPCLNKLRGAFAHDNMWAQFKTTGFIPLYKRPTPAKTLRPLHSSIEKAITRGSSKKKGLTEKALDEIQEHAPEALMMIETATKDDWHRIVYQQGMWLLQYIGDEEEVVADIKEAAEANAFIDMKELDDLLEAARQKLKEPSAASVVRKEAGEKAVKAVRDSIEMAPDGKRKHVPYSQIFRRMCPNLGYYDDPLSNNERKSGEWLNHDDVRWWRLTPHQMKMEARRIPKADGVIVDGVINTKSQEVVAALKGDAYRGDVDEIDVGRFILDGEGKPINLKTGKISKPDPDHPLMRRLNAVYDPSCTDTTYADAVAACLTPGRSKKDAAEVLRFHRMKTGYTLLDVKRDQRMIINYGHGNNGKSTMQEADLDYMGMDFSTTMQPTIFLEGYRGDSETGLNVLMEMRKVTLEEPPNGKSWDSGIVKLVAGGGRMGVRERYKDATQAVVRAQIEVSTNTKVLFWDNTKGFLRKLIFIGWLHDFDNDPNKDKNMPERLRTKEAASGWLNYALAGLADYFKQGGKGLLVPDCIMRETEEYIDTAGDPIRGFFASHFKLIEDDDEAKGASLLSVMEIHQLYINYLVNTDKCSDAFYASRHYAKSPRMLRKKMEEALALKFVDGEDGKPYLQHFRLANPEHPALKAVAGADFSDANTNIPG